MSTHKHFDKICCVVLALTLSLTVLFVNAEKLGVEKASTVMEYENTLFDKSKVHTIDIIMDDWDEFTENARSEEYYNCSVVIDNEAFKNIAIRGKGNTSLSSVNNDRYSYKIEFDHYDNTNTYYGLDKLCLNNIIQDNTYMKDYLTYTMMNDMGVASPLCSYVYITVNGEDWGLYLAVEGVEESFLQRNYGKDYGELYKPDSMNMGGGRGNGNKFNMDEFMQNSEDSDKGSQNNKQTNETTNQSSEETTTTTTEQTTDFTPDNIPEGQFPEGMTPPDFSGGNPFGDEMPEGMTPPDFGGGNPFGGEMPEGMTPPNMGGGNFRNGNNDDSNAFSINGMSKTNTTESETNSSQNEKFGGMTPPDFSSGNPFGGKMPEGITPQTDENGNFQIPENFKDSFGGGFGGMGSSDVKLQYIDDNIDSYSNIFGNAKTDITKADKNRLIEAIKKLANGEEPENAVDIDAVIRYFVVHNFVVNGDSYTGSMIHNYYLYEKDSLMQMIPWDYNLAFGTFMSAGTATNSVNDPIDTPLSVTGSGDRPMIDWIFSSEEYTEMYHQYFSEFISEYFDSGYFTEMIDTVKSLISPYVEKDPTKFCTYEDFETGIGTLKDFCLLRSESVKGQLNGTIGSTSDTQKNETLVDASELNLSSMGSMGGMGGKGVMNRPISNKNTASYEEIPTTEGNAQNSGDFRPQMPDNFQGGTRPGFENGKNDSEHNNSNNQMQKPDSNSRPDNNQFQSVSQTEIPASSLVIIGISILILAIGIVFALKYKKRKY